MTATEAVRWLGSAGDPAGFIEPVGLLDGRSADEAVAAGIALRLGGTALAFTHARSLDAGGCYPGCLGAVLSLNDWRRSGGVLPEHLTRAPPAWAGLPAGRPLVMGILNATPDSFSDAGDNFDPARAIEAGRAMAASGADILDVGGESTRPGSCPVAPQEEQRRVVPIVRALASAGHVVSIDTRNAATMAAALDAGARIVNDVSALAHDPDSAALVASRRAPVVLMHLRGTPDTMMSLARYDDVAAEVTRELAQRIAAAEAAGIAHHQIAVDPGIGFAKDGPQNRELLRRLPILLNLGCRILLGVSRKSLVGAILGDLPAKQRGPGSLAAALFGLARGATILRVHDVIETVQAVRVWQALAG